MKSIRFSYLATVCLFLLASLVGCGGGGGGGSALATPAFDVTASWSGSSEVTGGSCGNQGLQLALIANLSQNGNTVTGSVNGVSGSGTISGNQISISVSYPEDGGTTTENITGTVDSIDSMHGSSSGSWTDGVETCSFTTSWTLTRIGGGGSGGSPFAEVCSIGGPIPIVEGNPVVTALNVSPGSCDTVYWDFFIDSLDGVGLYTQDMIVMLQSPSGTTVILYDGPSDTISPSPLANFSGEDSAGQWLLSVEDLFNPDPDDDDPALFNWCISGNPL